MNKKQISVIMPCYQQVRFLEEAVRSVLDQQNVEVELIVLDPGSADGSRELLQDLRKEYGEKLVLVFEPDEGQSDAINKGMRIAGGEILCWLNTDDRFRPGALSRVRDALCEADGPAWLYGHAGIVDGDGRKLFSFITWYKKFRGRRFSRLKLLTECFISQMATFWNREMWEQAGELDVSRHLDMDYDLWLRFARHADPVIIDEELADFRIHGEAKGSHSYSPQLDAAFETARKHAGELGSRGKLALAVHWLFSLRTRLIYRIIKP